MNSFQDVENVVKQIIPIVSRSPVPFLQTFYKDFQDLVNHLKVLQGFPGPGKVFKRFTRLSRAW